MQSVSERAVQEDDDESPLNFDRRPQQVISAIVVGSRHAVSSRERWSSNNQRTINDGKKVVLPWRVWVAPLSIWAFISGVRFKFPSIGPVPLRTYPRIVVTRNWCCWRWSTTTTNNSDKAMITYHLPTSIMGKLFSNASPKRGRRDSASFFFDSREHLCASRSIRHCTSNLIYNKKRLYIV